jgi:hypothetical protein
VSRTAHHHPSLHGFFSDHHVVVVDFRYSIGCLEEAISEGRRPQPARLRHEVRRYDRAGTDARLVAARARTTNRRHRRVLRESARAVVHLVNRRAGGPLRMEAAGVADIAPARHRRDGLWYGGW